MTRNGVTSWDRDRQLQVIHEPISAARVMVAILLFLVVTLVIAQL